MNINLLIKIYTAVTLIAAAILCPLNLSFIPVLLLIWFFIQWLWPISRFISLLTTYFLYFAVGLLFSRALGQFWPLIIAAPLMFSFDQSLKEIARFTRPDHSEFKRSLTNAGMVLASVTATVLFVAIVIGNLTLLISVGFVIFYFLILAVRIFKLMPKQPFTIEQTEIRAIAGNEQKSEFVLHKNALFQGTLFLNSPFDWFQVTPNAFLRIETKMVFSVFVKPTLSGPREIQLTGYFIDPWGLMQFRFDIEPIKLNIIPRAKYALWLVQKYLAGAGTGNLPLISTVSAIKTNYGLRGGVEFYGNRMYQAGDSLKNIDWKHTIKYDELVSREMVESRTQPAIMLINTVAGNDEETDDLTYNILLTALSLAHSGIPAALAVYNSKKVVFTTPSLDSIHLVVQALEATKNIEKQNGADKYFNTADVMRLRSNINRLSQTQNRSAGILRELLQLEFLSLHNRSRDNACTRALTEVRKKINQPSTLVVVSQCNHDAEAIAFNTYNLAARGNKIIRV